LLQLRKDVDARNKCGHDESNIQACLASPSAYQEFICMNCIVSRRSVAEPHDPPGF
jgi:hypothetical protein